MREAPHYPDINIRTFRDFAIPALPGATIRRSHLGFCKTAQAKRVFAPAAAEDEYVHVDLRNLRPA
jgi:hypothetical protein